MEYYLLECHFCLHTETMVLNRGYEEMDFVLHSEYKPTGDQPQAIKELVEGFKRAISARRFSALRVQARLLPWLMLLRR